MYSRLLLCVWIGLAAASLLSCGDSRVVASRHTAPSELRDTLAFDVSTLQATFLATAMQQVGEEPMRAAIKAHYASLYRWVWLRGDSTPQRVQQLMALLHTAPEHGLASYMQPTLKQLAKQAEAFTADSLILATRANARVATYELALTQAYLRLVAALRYGAVDPFLVINHAPQVAKRTALRPRYPRYYAYATARPDSAFYAEALAAATGAVAFAQHCAPADSAYTWLCQALANTTRATHRKLLTANLERLRWRTLADTSRHGKRVVVNLPAQMLEAFDAQGQPALRMKVCYGDLNHRTPLLASHIHRADLNPNWTVPPSILNNDVATRYVGNSGYFERQRMRAYERATNKEVAPESLTAEQWRSGKYRLTQTGGVGGALGRIVFRFANPYMIYLHDTNQPSAFQRAQRNVSHGCIRVEQPYALACFLLAQPDSLRQAHIAYTIGHDTQAPSPPKQTLHSVRYANVPLFIDYYTAWPQRSDSVSYYPDVYGYDTLILQALTLW